MASVWISNCHAKNKRLQYLNLLQTAGVTVESYGICDRTKNPKPDQKEIVAGRHLFLFAFENTDCVDYVTEKVFHGLRAGTVPVYMGTRSVIRDVPFHSIIQTSNFNSAENLAAYLQYLTVNESANNSYFEWRNYGFPPKLKRKIKLSSTFGTHQWRCEAPTRQPIDSNLVVPSVGVYADVSNVPIYSQAQISKMDVQVWT